MFGVKPGEERFQGTLNQFVITKLTGKPTSYWVLHTKGEDAVSVLINALALAKMDTESMMTVVQSLQLHMLSQMEWAAVKVQQESGLIVYAWGSAEDRINLHDVLNNLWTLRKVSSRVLGYEKGAIE